MKKEDYGINGDHEKLGNSVSMAEFKGKTLEALKNIEKRMNFIESEIQKNTHFREQVIGAGKFLGLIALLSGIIGAIITFL